MSAAKPGLPLAVAARMVCERSDKPPASLQPRSRASGYGNSSEENRRVCFACIRLIPMEPGRHERQQKYLQ